jgi:hypothetical protein
MNKGILAVAAIASTLSAAVPPSGAIAMTLAPFAGTANAPASLVQKAGIYCGPLGCGPVWPGPRRWKWAQRGPWDHVYRPACPIDYYYACRRGPLGYGQCACWPYRTW